MNVKADIEPATEIGASARPTNLAVGLEQLESFAKEFNAVDSALDALISMADEGGVRATQKLKERLDAFEPCITVLGQVKAGKTSLINAMAGWPDLLPSDVNPWTSVVTSLHLTPDQSRKAKGATFQFMTENDWDRIVNKGGRMGELAGRAGAESELDKLSKQVQTIREKAQTRLGRNFELLMGQKHEYGYFDKNLLERYICLGDEFDLEDDDEDEGAEDQGQFADITNSADLFLSCQTLPFKMCLRDTPGVNDTFMMREQITIKAIRDSRICLVVLSAGQALTSVDMGLIRLISNLKSREVIIYVNRIDELSDPVHQTREIEKSIRQTLEDHHGPKDAEIIFGSAFWANKALTGRIEEIGEDSSAALLDWVEAKLTAGPTNDNPVNMVWEVSGLPDVLRAVSERAVSHLGEPLLGDISRSALKTATGLQAAHSIQIQPTGDTDLMDADTLWGRFAELQETHIASLSGALDEHIAEYQERADRAHGTFVNRATHSLISHLDKWGEHVVWEYDPSGLRILLRSAFSLLGSRTKNTAKTHYEDAVANLAELLYLGFGDPVAGIQIDIPEAPEAPPPVVLGQMIALDCNDGWWRSWWRRQRGYDAFATKFAELISAETEQFMVQVKHDQTAEIKSRILAKMQDEFDEYREILIDLTASLATGGDLKSVIESDADSKKREKLDRIVAAFRPYVQ